MGDFSPSKFLLTIFHFYFPAYHWDTSDWMPSTRLSHIKDVPGFESQPGSNVASSATCPVGCTRELESDYYLGGYDIDSDSSPSHVEEFLNEEQLPPTLPTDEDFSEPYMPMPAKLHVPNESTLNSGSNGHQLARAHFHPNQYLLPHQLPFGETPQMNFSTPVSGVTAGNGDTNNSVSLSLKMPLSIHASSTSYMSGPSGLNDCECESDFDSADELSHGVTIITDSQQQTQL